MLYAANKDPYLAGHVHPADNTKDRRPIYSEGQLAGFYAPGEWKGIPHIGTVYISPEHRRKGLALSTAQAYQKEHPDMCWFTSKDNKASQGVAERLGLVAQATKLGPQHIMYGPQEKQAEVPSALLLMKEAVKIERRQFTETAQVSRKPSAVIIKGNPKWIKGNDLAAKFYNQIADHLRQKQYSVTFDKGEPHTQPPVADLWIGHSRGVDRLRFAPKGTKTIDLTPLEHPVSQMVMQRQDAIRKQYGVERVSDLPPEAQLTPPPHHYFFTKEMKQRIDAVTNEKNKKVQTSRSAAQ